MIYTYISVAIIYSTLLILSFKFRGATKISMQLTLAALIILTFTYFYRNPVFLPPRPITILIYTLAILIVLYIILSIRIINQGEEALVERLGRYHRKLKPGLNFIVPTLEYIRLKDSVRERILDLPKLKAITRDRVSVEIDAIIYWRILELELTYYGVEDVEQAIQNLTITILRSEIGKMELNYTFSSRHEINRALLSQLDESTEPWGVKVTGVEIREIGILENLSERDVISIPFPDGINWNAFKESLIRVVAENDGIELTVQGIENTDDGFMIIKVKVPENTDKEKILVDFGKYYGIAEKLIEAKFRAELKGKEEQIEIYRQNSASIERIIEALSSKPIGLLPQTIEIQANAITGGQNVNNSSDNSQNINVGRDINLSGSTLNLGEINGSITNLINQISTLEPRNRQLKELLVEIRDILNNSDDMVLPPEDKVDALDQVKMLAEAAQLPEQEKRTLGGKAIRFLQRIVDAIPTSLPTATSLVTEMNKLIPQIATLLGIL
ncbi:MAG: Modulator of FtsH protease HflC [Cyanobacteriota bacterium]|jgi:hypothetical protein